MENSNVYRILGFKARNSRRSATNKQKNMVYKKVILAFLCLSFFSCRSAPEQNSKSTQSPPPDSPTEEMLDLAEDQLLLGIEQPEKYISLLQNKRVGLIVNHTSIFPNTPEQTHLVDFLLSEKINVVKVFAPEHGFRGKADAGAHVSNEKDTKTGLPIISLYGKNKKPTQEQLKDVDILIFDIQDVGVRFYTYISTMHYAMEAAAENKLPFIVLDRPNPNAHIVDGPVLEEEHKSFVGMHPIPVIHGLTVGELARMINGEGWLAGEKTCELTVIPNQNYTHTTAYTLPVKPSPNLPNQQSILLYPSLCFFEGTPLSIGRGTPFPFQVVGYPNPAFGKFTFTPKPTDGANNPKLNGQTCYGLDLREITPPNRLDIGFLLLFYNLYPQKDEFFTSFFTLLAGTEKLEAQIKAGKTEEEIRAGWADELELYKLSRADYLLYDDTP
jgi:uncharacterized protein YbbC (DUF1343 family)